MVAGVATLTELIDEVYVELRLAAMRLADGLAQAARSVGVKVAVVRAETFLSVFFGTDRPPRNFSEVDGTDKEAFARFHRAMRSRGMLLPPSPFEAWFPSLVHTPDVIDATIEVARYAFAESS
jgi:glutamate-1-semialdehyde 2,1-aminomutase